MCITNPLKISDFQGNLLYMLLFSQKHAFYFSILRIKEVTTDMNALESSAMSVVENILGSLIYAAVCTLVLLLFNWRIGLITLAGLGIGILLLRVVQENAKKVMPVRFQAQEEMTEKTLEFIQGNMVMRLFGTGRDGLNRVKEAFHKKQEADIIVLDNGHVVQQGTHETLLQQDGIYRRFVKIRQTASSWKI